MISCREILSHIHQDANNEFKALMDLAIKVFEIGCSTSLNNYSKLIRFVPATPPPFSDFTL